MSASTLSCRALIEFKAAPPATAYAIEMERFSITVIAGGLKSCDNGQAFPDLRSAQREALVAALDIITELTLADRSAHVVTARVEDEAGEIRTTVTLTLDVINV